MLSFSKLNRRDNLRRIVSKPPPQDRKNVNPTRKLAELSICFKVFKSPLAPLGHGAMMAIKWHHVRANQYIGSGSG
jgi:hypothetical protein